MAIIDIVKCEMQNGEFCSKFPSDEIKIGSQLVVYPSQTAFFVKGGSICDDSRLVHIQLVVRIYQY